MTESKLNFSVVITTFNREWCVANAINSAFLQTLQPSEIIVVDNCSTDATLKVVEMMQNPLVKLLKNDKNRGYNFSLVRGVNEAKGEVVAFLDSDDTWDEHYLEFAADAFARLPEINLISNPRPDLVTASQRGKVLGFTDLLIKGQSFTNMSGTIVKKVFIKNKVPNPLLPTEISKRYICQDDIFWFEAARMGSFYVSPLSQVRRHVSQNSISSDLRLMADGWRLFYENYKDDYLINELKSHYGNHLLRVAGKYLETGALRKSISTFNIGIKSLGPLTKKDYLPQVFKILFESILRYIYHFASPSLKLKLRKLLRR